jgi:polyphenol oxidase
VQANQADSIKYYQFYSFEDQGLYHAVFTRQGGISPSPWKSLNFGASVGDDGKRVLLNKQYALAALGIGMESVYDVHQVHSTEIVLAEHALAPGAEHIKADAIITRTPGVSLLMRFADCVPILLFDPVNRAIGMVHAGWKGTINKIVAKTVMRMEEVYGTDPGNLLVGIGPSIGPDHYSIGGDVEEKVHLIYGEISDQVLIHSQDKTYFDLWKANTINLNDVGVYKIELAEICTQCKLDEWYSHRGEQGQTGRFGIVFGLVS